MNITRRGVLFVLAATALAFGSTWLLPPTVIRYGAAFALLWLLPAVAWAGCLPGDVLIRGVSGLGLAFVGSGLATLALHLLPGAFPGGIARGVHFALVLIPLLVGWIKAGRSESHSTSPTAPAVAGTASGARERGVVEPRYPSRYGIVLIVLVALLARLPNLGYSEFQGDEALIMQRAADALSGDDAELFLHQKGPVEILLPMSLWSLTETVSEWQARLPYALAGVLAVLVVAALSRQWFGPQAGVFAGLLMAINGFLVAFSRIVQYQSLVVAMGGLCLLWLLQARGNRRRLGFVLAAVFLAFGLLAHYDAVLIVPAAMVVVLQLLLPQFREGGAWRGAARDLLLAIASGAAILAVFYVPFFANPMFSRTASYLLGGRLGQGLLHSSLWDVWRMSTFYNALYYVVSLGLLIVSAAIIRRGSLATWLTFATPFFFYCFIVADPRTHVYTFYPGAAVLAGAVLTAAATSLGRSPVGKAAFFGGFGLWYVLCMGYVGLAFVDHAVEYKRAWPESRRVLYPVPFADDALSPYGHFGFPYQAGWKAVAYLYDQGIIQGTYASNEEPEITTWYLPDATRTLCGQPDVYVVAKHVQDEVEIDLPELERDYGLVAQIDVEGQTKIWVYGLGYTDGEILALTSRESAGWYDATATVDRHRSTLPDVMYPVGADFGAVGRLLGYDLTTDTVQRGDALRITLVWQALSSPARNYQVFTHLVDGESLLAQHDGAPACAHAPSSLWEAGEVIRDEHTLTVDATVPLGTLDLYVGLYDLTTFERLPVNGGPSDAILLTRLEVIP